MNALVEPDAVLPAALDVAGRIAANAPMAVAAAKELTRLALSDPARADERLGELVEMVFSSEDAAEGARAFVEKHAPQWRGR